jgi:hypothetical protein
VQVGSLTGKMTGASLIRILLALPVLMLAVGLHGRWRTARAG